ncbi:anaphase-promoting complex subunit 2 [Tanacetum coccineum]
MFVEVLYWYFQRRLEELSTIIAGDDKDNYNHKKTLENIGMVVHNLINLIFTSVTEDAYASAIFLLLKVGGLRRRHEKRVHAPGMYVGEMRRSDPIETKDVLEKHGAPNFWKHFDAFLDLEMEERDVQEALEEISREKQYQEKFLMTTLPHQFTEVLYWYFQRRLEELSTIIAGDDKDNYNHKKTLENIGMVVHNLINLRFTSMTEDAYASSIFLLLKQSCQSQPTIDTRINLHILQHQSKSPVLSQGVYESVHENQLTHTRRVLNECTETDETEPVSFYRSLRARWRAIVDGLSDVVVTNAGTIRQFAMKTCVNLLPVVGDTKGNYCKIGQAHGCTTTVINVMKKKDKMLSNFNCQHLDVAAVKYLMHAIDPDRLCNIFPGCATWPMIHQNFYYAGLNFTSPAFPCAMSDMLHAMTFVMAVLCRYIEALSAIANDQKSYRLYGLGKADKNIRIEVVDEKKEMASETIKTINSGLAVKIGIPLVW